MSRTISILSLVATLALIGPSMASAAQCRDAKGKFIACATATAVPAKKVCKDAKGKFTKCPAPMAAAVAKPAAAKPAMKMAAAKPAATAAKPK